MRVSVYSIVCGRLYLFFFFDILRPCFFVFVFCFFFLCIPFYRLILLCLRFPVRGCYTNGSRHKRNWRIANEKRMETGRGAKREDRIEIRNCQRRTCRRHMIMPNDKDRLWNNTYHTSHLTICINNNKLSR